MTDVAAAIGLQTHEPEVQCTMHCYGGTACMAPTAFPEYTPAGDVWVRGDLVLARLAELDARVIAAEGAIEAHNRAMVDRRPRDRGAAVRGASPAVSIEDHWEWRIVGRDADKAMQAVYDIAEELRQAEERIRDLELALSQAGCDGDARLTVARCLEAGPPETRPAGGCVLCRALSGS